MFYCNTFHSHNCFLTQDCCKLIWHILQHLHLKIHYRKEKCTSFSAGNTIFRTERGGELFSCHLLDPTVLLHVLPPLSTISMTTDSCTAAKLSAVDKCKERMKLSAGPQRRLKESKYFTHTEMIQLICMETHNENPGQPFTQKDIRPDCKEYQGSVSKLNEFS